ncbi:hypothetical protein KIW84_071589 [Lathyrus oleraceus]|uniref:DUF4283 domain-containing protein n=1 Tax=Pisum sativum TaxID=3888 RepID=A0A9D4ZTB7_PEA|nr:hypothetical protein KIW84_071589 [Pisum sativum]
MSLGKGYFDFSFSSLEDSRRVRSVNSWSLNPGYLKLFTWTKDFNSSSLKQTFAQVWIHIHGLSQEYWRPKINFAIASSIRTPFCTDFAIIKSCFDRPFGHYVRVLVDLDLYNELRSENVNVEVNDEVNHATDLIGKDLYVSDKVPVDVGETSLARNITINIPSATVGFPLPHNSAGKPATKDIPRDIPVEDFIEHNPRSDVEEVLEVVPETQLIMPNINHYESEHVSNTHGSFKMIPSLESTLQKDIQFLNNTWANVMDQEGDNPWCFISDYNSILRAHEHHGRLASSRAHMLDFSNWSDKHNLHHIPTSGSFLTWTNGRKGNDNIQRRLDRSICDQPWIDSCSSMCYSTLTKTRYDHFPLMIDFDCQLVSYRSSFRFMEMWMQHPDYETIIKSTWESSIVRCPMFILSRKLQLLKTKFKEWKKSTFGNFKVMAQCNLDDALNNEEIFWKEKGNVKWHADGDRNTKFFQRIVKKRNTTSLLHSMNIGDNVSTDPEEISNHEPLSLLRDIERWCRNFIWSGDIAKRKMVTVSWRNCFQSLDSGSFGLRRITSLNNAANLISCWELASSQDPWALVLRARVQRQGGHIKHHVSSSLWSGLNSMLQGIMVANHRKDTIVWCPKVDNNLTLKRAYVHLDDSPPSVHWGSQFGIVESPSLFPFSHGGFCTVRLLPMTS